MSFLLSPRARDDLDGIWDYIGIERGSPGAAERQIELLYDKFALLASHPRIGQSCDNLRSNLRCFSAGNYVIFFCPTEEGIEVERVIHGARDIEALFDDTET